MSLLRQIILESVTENRHEKRYENVATQYVQVIGTPAKRHENVSLCCELVRELMSRLFVWKKNALRP